MNSIDNNAAIQALIDLHFRSGASITPSDVGTHNYNAITTTSGGDVKIDLVSGDTVTIYLGAGDIGRYKITRVYATGTTATGIVGLNTRE